MSLDLRPLCGELDFCWVVFDSLRYDVARSALDSGRLLHLGSLISAWERRHTPATFTFAAHQAFFAGFLPTPIQRGDSFKRNWALDFAGSSSVDEQTLRLSGANVCEGLRSRGYRTICLGGVGFFNRQTPLSCVLPDLFCESHWTPEMGVTSPHSTRHQVERALEVLAALPSEQRAFLFFNLSATHQPTHIYLPEASPIPQESVDSQLEALVDADRELGPLWSCLRQRGGACCWAFSDHGTAMGEEGRWGHRWAHPVVWEVPYAEFVLSAENDLSSRL